jgi:hypothetical protein
MCRSLNLLRVWVDRALWRCVALVVEALLADLRCDPDLKLSSPDEVSRLCMDNLIASPEERVFFKDLQSRILLVSAGWLEAEGQDRSGRRISTSSAARTRSPRSRMSSA